MNLVGVSLIVCCHNGVRRLPETIRHISAQQVRPGLPWEFVVVDNGSNDGSDILAERTWLDLGAPAPLRVIHEPRIGLGYARARAFEEARFECVILCDDDNWLAPDFIETAQSVMEKHRNIGVIGACGELRFERPLPESVCGLEVIFAAGPQARYSGRVVANRVYGAGCAIRKSAYDKLAATGFQSKLVDREGTSLSSGGDHELCYAIAILGYEIWFDHRLKFTHAISADRLTLDYFNRYAVESSRCFDLLTSYKFVASRLIGYRYAELVLIREIVYSIRMILAFTWQAVFHLRESRRRLARFRLQIFCRKVFLFPFRFNQMRENHRTVVAFHDICRQMNTAGFAESAETTRVSA